MVALPEDLEVEEYFRQLNGVEDQYLAAEKWMKSMKKSAYKAVATKQWPLVNAETLRSRVKGLSKKTSNVDNRR